MKLTLYNAISIDGFIATLDDNTDWVKDWEYYEKEIKENDVVIYGRRTYEDMVKTETFPIEGVRNIVYTSNPEKFSNVKEAKFTNSNPKDLLEELRINGTNNILVAGGGITNAAFLKNHLIDFIVIDIHPIILGEGIKIFEGSDLPKINMEKVGEKDIGSGIIQVRYKVLK